VTSDAEHDAHGMPVAAFATLEEAHEHVLVALAMGRECTVTEEPPSFVIRAGEMDVDPLRREFGIYARERAEFMANPAPVETRTVRGDWEWALLWILTLLAAYHFQGEDPAVTERWRNSSRALFDQGEWWRPFTALFLHADMGHLLGNALFGAAFFSWVTSHLGHRTGWLLIFAGGTIGNLLSAWIHYPADYLSLGASTATFGALGILTGISTQIAWNFRVWRRPMQLLGPAIAGLILLSWLGAGETPTDVLAHALGFAAGAMLGWIAAGLRTSRRHHLGVADLN